MNRRPQSKNWFFPIEEAPVLATVTHSGKALNVRVPRKKALVAAGTDDIVGIRTVSPQRIRQTRPCYTEGDCR